MFDHVFVVCGGQVALNVKAVAPSVLSSLEAAIANVDEVGTCQHTPPHHLHPHTSPSQSQTPICGV
jgi:hypothetical protein